MNLEPLYAEEASKKQIEEGKEHGKEGGRGKKKPLVPFETKGLAANQQKAAAKAAKRVGHSPTTYHRVKTVLSEAPEMVYQPVLDNYGNKKRRTTIGRPSPAYVYKNMKLARDHKETPKLPKGQFDVIYADPLWKYDVVLRGDSGDHYQTMRPEEIPNQVMQGWPILVSAANWLDQFVILFISIFYALPANSNILAVVSVSVWVSIAIIAGRILTRHLPIIVGITIVAAIVFSLP